MKLRFFPLAGLLGFGLGPLSALPVRADTPEPPNATIPCVANLVGTTAGVADPRGEFSVVVWGLAGDPLPGASVSIVFDNCTDIRIALAQPFPGVSVDCAGVVGRSVTAITDDHGSAWFRIVGAARNSTGGEPGAGLRCARVYADGVLLGYANVGAFDQNGIGGVNPVDVALCLDDFSYAGYVGRSDFDCNEVLSPADLSLLLSASLAAGSSASGASYCH
jgi:hypothetical protein